MEDPLPEEQPPPSSHLGRRQGGQVGPFGRSKPTGSGQSVHVPGYLTVVDGRSYQALECLCRLLWNRPGRRGHREHTVADRPDDLHLRRDGLASREGKGEGKN